ncbi:MAG: pilus assembly protein PilM [Planctomycetota bacterium]|jgi:Tfp pilus assembly PilM family ATPase
MVGFFKSEGSGGISLLRRTARTLPVGIDISDEAVRMIQLAFSTKTISLVAGGSQDQPDGIKTGSADWQRWTVGAIRELAANGRFNGKEVIAGIPAADIFIEHTRMPKTDGNGSRAYEAIISKVKQKLPCPPEKAMIKCVPAEQNNVLVIAAERKVVDRHLAIYENANLQLKSISIWPTALARSYVRLFGRRKADLNTIVMLLAIDNNRTNLVICRHENLLFARSIPIGANQLENDEVVTRLVYEIAASKRQFASMYKNARIERSIFFSAKSDSGNAVCGTIAKQLEMPAQIGDCLGAIKIPDPANSGIDRRGCQINWATAFGLSLS